MFTVFLWNSIPYHLSGSSQRLLPSPVACRFHSLPCSQCVFPASWKRLLKAGASRQAGAVNVERKGARNPLQQSCAPTACRSTFCSLSVVSHSQFRELALFLSLSHPLSLDRLRTHSLTHFVMLLPSTSSLSPLLLTFLLLCFFPVSETFTCSEWAGLKPEALMNPPSHSIIGDLSPHFSLYLSLFDLLIPQTN